MIRSFSLVFIIPSLILIMPISSLFYLPKIEDGLGLSFILFAVGLFISGKLYDKLKEKE